MKKTYVHWIKYAFKKTNYWTLPMILWLEVIKGSKVFKNHLFQFGTYIYSKSICKIQASRYLSPIKVKINKHIKSPCNGFEYLDNASSEYYIPIIWLNWVLLLWDILSDIYGEKKRMGCIKSAHNISIKEKDMQKFLKFVLLHACH